MAVEQELKQSRDDQWCIRLKTRHPDGDSLDGVVNHSSDELVVLREVRDFEFDGCVVLARRELRGIRNGGVERCTNAILRENGELEALTFPSWLGECRTLRAVADELQRTDTWPAIEVLHGKRRRVALYLGPVTRVTRKQITIWCYDAAGRWEGEHRLDYDQIFKVELDSAYCRHFNAFMRGRNGA